MLYIHSVDFITINLTDIEVFTRSAVVFLSAQIDGWTINLYDRIMKNQSPYSWAD